MGQLAGKLERRDGIPDHHPTREKVKRPTEQFPFENLPENVQNDIIQEVLGRLPPKERLRLSLVGKAWRKAARGSIKQIYMRDFTTELRRDGPLTWTDTWLYHGYSTSTKTQKALEEFFNLLSGLSKTLDTLAIPWMVLAYGFSLNRWATLPVMGNVKTIIMCVKPEEMTRIQDVLEKFPAVDSLVLYYSNYDHKRDRDGDTVAFPTDFPTTWRKLTIHFYSDETSRLYDWLTRQANLNWLDMRHHYLEEFGSHVPALNALSNRLTTLRLGSTDCEVFGDLCEALKQMANLVFLELQETVHRPSMGDELLNSVKMLSKLQALHLKKFGGSSNALQELFREPQMQLKRAVLTDCLGVDHLAIDALLTGNPGLEGVSLHVLAYSAPKKGDGNLMEDSDFFKGTGTSTDDWSFAFRNLGLLKKLKVFRVLVDLDPLLGSQKEPLPSDFVVRLRASDHPDLKYAGIVQWDWTAKDLLPSNLTAEECRRSPPATTAMVRMGDQLCQADWVLLPEPQHLVRDGIRAEVGNQEVTIPLELSDAYCFKAFFIYIGKMVPTEEMDVFCEELLIGYDIPAV